MRILHVNKFLYRRGGAEAYMEDLAELQSSAGHHVAFFGMQHPDNPPLPYEGHFPELMEFEPAPAGLNAKARGFARMVWSTSAARGIDAVLADFVPDVVHLHNVYHQLSPSILRPVAKRSIAAVMTLHDYKLACPTYQFLDANGDICEDCLGRQFHRCVLNRCKDGSVGASAALAVESAIHVALRAYGPVRIFVCPSEFLADKMRSGRVYPERLRHVPHFVASGAISPKSEPGGPLVFVGRLAREKAVDVLIEAMASVDAPLIIAGEGPERSALEDQARRIAPGRITFVGRVPRSGALDLIRQAIAVVVPSRWYENQPIVLLEAMASGVPVVATALGGVPELVSHGEDGVLVPPGDPGALAAALQALILDPDAALEMGRAGRLKVQRDFSPEAHLTALDRAYAEAQCA